MLLQPRWAMWWLRGPMTRGELRLALDKNETAKVAETCTTETAVSVSVAV